MAKKIGGLGKDFLDIYDDNVFDTKKAVAEMLRIADIEPRKSQPRKTFEREALEVLADSIAQYGVLQPIIVREVLEFPGSYEIIAGERRWRAAKMAGLSEIPAVIFTGDDLKTAQVALIENVQRENLNPVEEAMAYDDLIEKYDITQEQLAAQIGKSRSAITNMLRLLDLPDEVLEMLKGDEISAGHARALLGLKNKDDIVPLALRTVAKSLSVRDVETAVKKLNNPKERAELEDEGVSMAKIHMKELEHRSMEALGRKVRILDTPKKKVIELTFDDDSDLEYLLTALCGKEIFDEM